METLKENPELMEWIKSVADRGGAFVESEAPKFASEVVAWHFWSSVLFAVLAMVVIAAGAFCWWLAYRILQEDSCMRNGGPPHPGFMLSVLGALLGVLGGLVMLGVGVTGAIKAHVAPRLVIVEALRGSR